MSPYSFSTVVLYLSSFQTMLSVLSTPSLRFAAIFSSFTEADSTWENSFRSWTICALARRRHEIRYQKVVDILEEKFQV